MILHLVRHGESLWNAEGRVQGQTPDVPLTDVGRDQAEAAGRALAGRPVAAVISSDLLRARQTAEGLAGGRPIEWDPRLREQALGELEGRLASELEAQPVPEGRHISEIAWGGGESVVDVHARLSDFVRDLGRRFGADDHVVLVSHADALRVLIAVVRGRGAHEVDWTPLAPGSITTLDFDPPSEGNPMPTLDETIAAIAPLDSHALQQASTRQQQLTKPAGSLGLLEEVGIRLSGITATCPPRVPTRPVIGVFAGDHGVCAQGVTPWPQEVTVQMLMNMAAGGAAINVLGRQMGAEVRIVDVGVAGDHPDHPAIERRTVRRGTADFTVEPAMTRDEARAALEVGIAVANEAIDAGADLLLTGDMGIGNTTASSALISVFTGVEPAQVTGRGTGADDAMLAHKAEVIARGIALHQPQASDGLGVLSAVGGLEHAGIAGFILGGAARRVPVVLDGVIACSSALVAVALAPETKGYLFSGHAGAEPGIRAAVDHLGLQPLVDLGLRLGEGSGAALAVPLVQASARILGEMATFADAGIEA